MTERGLLMVSHLGNEINETIARHWSAPEIVVPPPDKPYWDLPAETRVLFTTPQGWKAASPPERPASWPEGLRWIQSESVGVDAYPKWLLESGTVTSARGSNAPSIAEYVMAEILGTEKRVHETGVRSPAQWKHIRMGSPEGRVLGLAGFGSIGAALATRAQAFGMKVFALRRGDWSGEAGGIEPVADIGSLFERSDHLVLAMPITPQTRHIVDAAALARAKPGLHLINVARGALLDHAALLAALDSGTVARATLDVTDPEPLPAGHPFYTHPKVRLTPHLSWDGDGNAARMIAIILDNLDRFAKGEPMLNVVDPVRGY